jgi:hypothetical protein
LNYDADERIGTLHFTMTEPTLNYVPCPDASAGGHRMAYWEWGHGQPAIPHLVVCVHGLSRQGRDFDTWRERWWPVHARFAWSALTWSGAAQRLAGRPRWATRYPTYAADMLACWQQLQQQAPMDPGLGGHQHGRADRHGPGGPARSLPAVPAVPVRRLVLNDVGPVIEWLALQRIGQYLGQRRSV